MKKFEGFLILTDIDGTLTNRDGEISRENAEAVRYFQEEGGLLSIASGRYPWYIEKYADRLIPNTYVIGVNGTMLYHPARREIVEAIPFPCDYAEVVRQGLADNPCVSCVMISNAVHDFHIYKEDFERIDAVLSEIPLPWYRGIFIQEASRTASVMKNLTARYGTSLAIDRSWPEGIELHAPNTGKGQMLKKIRALLASEGTPVHTAVCVGDYENDLTMFREADIGYAVANAIDEVKAAADRITVSNNDHALAAVIADLERSL